ncbi:MAG TPA: RNA 2',3'-cyclic phosphodiesterase [Opitutaceae bacterium]
MPPATRRLFVAIDAPPAVSESLAALAQPIRGFKWTHPETLHLTLRFIGDTPSGEVGALAVMLRAIRDVASFVLTIGGVGVFPQRGAAQVVWAGIEVAHPRLHQLRQRVDDAILAAGLAPDMRSFHPHFTLARCAGATPGAVHDFVHTHAAFQGPSFLVDRFNLFESRLLPGGAEHNVLETFSLAPG